MSVDVIATHNNKIMLKASCVIVDVQGFKGNNNEFILKELAISFNEHEFQNFIVQPPHQFEKLMKIKQKEANWLSKNHHGLGWNDGSVTYKSVKKFLLENHITAVYVKGEEKKNWLSHMLQNKVMIQNLEEYGCPSFKVLRKTYPSRTMLCTSHQGICALKNASLLRFFFNDQKENIHQINFFL